MPLLRVNAGPNGLELHGSHHPLQPALLRLSRATGPAVIMIHGYKFQPCAKHRCPHDQIFSRDIKPHRRAVSWPRGLGLVGQDSKDIGIAFGWNARGSLWQAFRAAQTAGAALSGLIRQLRRIDSGRPVHLLTHSLGAQVALSALDHVAPGDLSRIVVLNAAAYQCTARSAMSCDAGRRAELFNITSGENTVFDFLFERLIPPDIKADRALGRGFQTDNAVTLRLDDAHLLDQLGRHGVHIAGRSRSVCHWSTYLRPGVFDLYRSLLRNNAPISQDALRQMINAPPRNRYSLGPCRMLQNRHHVPSERRDM